MHSWLEIPIPNHGQHHKWLRAFLRSIDRERECSGSIGGWLKEYGSDDEAAWYTFRSERVVDYVIATCLGLLSFSVLCYWAFVKLPYMNTYFDPSVAVAARSPSRSPARMFGIA